MEWCNQVTVVTGVARGLGRATARLLAQRGVCVNHAVHADAAEALVAEIATAILAERVQVAIKGLRGMDVRCGPMHNDGGLHGLAVTRS
jgi:NAD(P)-dependent dehydrogenase (short-subunit alcohol dehydrogenase family)